MQKIGRKSIVTEITILNQSNPCISSFQGRQYDDPEVFELLEGALHVSLNTL